MPTLNQKSQLEKRLREYRKKYLTKKTNLELDESGTRLMVNYFLSEVLGYIELEDIKTEYSIRGEYADYIIQIARKKHFVIEVKSIQLDLNERHLRQSVSYAANEGIDWIMLFNGKQIQLYRVIFDKPIGIHKVFEYDLSDLKVLRQSSEDLVYLCKNATLKNELETYWKRFDALTPESLCKYLYTNEVVNCLRRKLRHSRGIPFTQEDVFEALHQIVIKENKINKPNTLR